MAKIQVMSDHLSNLIAAGEVVSRPMNIVKECIENSLDAHAHSIEIEVFEGGISGVIITDDGDGMDPEDALLAFSNHATSKLKTEDDLFKIMTMGFRGEALASIGAVASVDLQTNDGNQGTHIKFEYGSNTLHEEYACPKGTRIEVRGLFSRTPARLKYLKKANYEFSVIAEAVNKLALSHPNIRFLLKHDGRTIFQTSGKGNQKEVLYQMYGREAAENCLPFSASSDDFQIDGYAIQPKISRASKNSIYVSINSRIIRSWPITNAVVEGYREYLPKDRYPIFLINIEVDPQLVDVNVHPNKLEVRLSKEEFLSQLIINTIENLFYDQLDTPSIDDSYERKKQKSDSSTQGKLELSYPNRSRPKEVQSDLVQMMNPNQEKMDSLRGNPHFDNYGVKSGSINQKWQEDQEAPRSALLKEVRAQFNGAIPSGNPYNTKKNHQKLPEADNNQDFRNQSFRKSDEYQNFDKQNFKSDNDQNSVNSGDMDHQISENRNLRDYTQEDSSVVMKPVHEESLSSETTDFEMTKNSFQDEERSDLVKDSQSSNGENSQNLQESLFEADHPIIQLAGKLAQSEEFIPGEISEEKARELNASAVGKEFFDHLTVIGQLHESYILCENPQGLVIIDQHAAQERCNFEKLQKELLKPTRAMQPRMVPLLIPVTPDLFVQLDHINELTEPFGLSFEAFGQSQLILREEPLWFSQVDQMKFIDDMLSGFQNTRSIDIAYMRRHMIATMACHSSIRFNRPLNRDEMEKVIWDLQQCDHPYHCPHGRPTVLKLSEPFLRKQFERT